MIHVYYHACAGSGADSEPVDSSHLQPHDAPDFDEADELHLTEASHAEEVDGSVHQKLIVYTSSIYILLLYYVSSKQAHVADHG